MSTETPASTPEGTDLRSQALRQLRKKKDFKVHLLIYVLVNAFLVTVWAMTGVGFFWPAFILGGWGIGLVANAWDAYGGGDVPTEGEIEHEMERLSRRR